MSRWLKNTLFSASIVSQEPTLSYFNRILTPDVESILNSTEQLTLFLPIDEAWGALEDIERKYLESRFATDDILRILNVHAIASEGVHWSDEFQQSLNRWWFLSLLADTILNLF